MHAVDIREKFMKFKIRIHKLALSFNGMTATVMRTLLK
jgi:hypothetical protein